MGNEIITAPNSGGSKRIEFIDALRGFTMFMVVLMHVGLICFQPKGSCFYAIMSNVRMPMFFLISGFVLYKAGVVWDLNYIVAFFKKKIPVQLLSPLLFFLVHMHVRGIDILDGILSGPKYGYWFTYVLFEFFVFYAFVRFFVRNRWSEVILLLMGVCFYPFSWPVIKQSIPLPPVFFEFISFQHWHFFIFFVIGTLVKKYYDVVQQWLDSKWLLPFCILFFFLEIAFSDLLPFNENWIAFPITMTGLVILFSFFRNKQHLFSHETRLGKVFQYVGRRTLDIYLIHYFLIPSSLKHVVTVFHEYSMPIIEGFVSVIIASLIIAMCLLIGNVIRLSPLLEHWVFGVKKVA